MAAPMSEETANTFRGEANSKQREVVLQPHPDYPGGYQLLVDGHDLSLIVGADGVTVDWQDMRPKVTITVFPDWVRLTDAAIELVEALAADGKKRTNLGSRS